MAQQRGAIGLNIMLVILLVVIGVLVYIMASPRRTSVVTDGIAVPTVPVAAVSGAFDDGLANPVSIRNGNLDEFGAGIASQAVFMVDVNGDGVDDRITRERVETGDAHGYTQYNVELNHNGEYRPLSGMPIRTVEGASCALMRVRFKFRPAFDMVVVSRPFSETWETPTVATIERYAVVGDQLNRVSARTVREVCDVTELL